MRAANSGLSRYRFRVGARPRSCSGGLVQDQERRSAVEARFQAVEQVGQHRQDHAGLAHQGLGLEGLHVGERQPVLGGVQQPTERAFQGIGRQRGLQGVGLQQHGEPGQGAFVRRRAGQTAERRPDGVLDLGGDADTFVDQQCADPLGGPAAGGGIVDGAQGLEGERAVCAQHMVGSAHGQHGGAGGVSLVEDEHLGTDIASELQRHQRQQHGLAGPGGSDDQHVADVADMGGQAERGRARGLGQQQRRIGIYAATERCRKATIEKIKYNNNQENYMIKLSTTSFLFFLSRKCAFRSPMAELYSLIFFSRFDAQAFGWYNERNNQAD